MLKIHTREKYLIKLVNAFRENSQKTHKIPGTKYETKVQVYGFNSGNQ